MEIDSPLRYPGGKTALAPFIAELIAAQRSRPITTYAEPYAGGAGAALRLLRTGVVERIKINDFDPRIATFWHHAVNSTSGMVKRVLHTPVSIDSWHRQREIYLDESSVGTEDLAYAVLFLNRTNRSGILSARPIGGLKQDGNWKIDARFNVQKVASKLREIGSLSDRISVSQLEALDFLRGLDTERTFVYLDPPYIQHGPALYLNSLTWRNHVELALTLRDVPRYWMLSYDHEERVPEVLYRGVRCAEFSIKHTAAQQQVGREFALFSPELRVPSLERLGRAGGTWYRSRRSSRSFNNLSALREEARVVDDVA